MCCYTPVHAVCFVRLAVETVNVRNQKRRENIWRGWPSLQRAGVRNAMRADLVASLRLASMGRPPFWRKLHEHAIQDYPLRGYP